ncbi:hypothetical protein B484DRAFT_458847 [Ochromonadaceae sp. CCMP2298]|nr:hypothetical protein B484DRAFT_458847 [Ochromonadaceae sp. CCMP2298]
MLFATHLLLALLVAVVSSHSSSSSSSSSSTSAEHPVPGGWTPADPHSKLVVNEIEFAVTVAYPGQLVQYHVLEASKQVVAGMNWDMVAEINLPSSNCVTDHYRVWDRFGDKTLTTNERVSSTCAGHRANP